MPRTRFLRERKPAIRVVSFCSSHLFLFDIFVPICHRPRTYSIVTITTFFGNSSTSTNLGSVRGKLKLKLYPMLNRIKQWFAISGNKQRKSVGSSATKDAFLKPPSFTPSSCTNLWRLRHTPCGTPKHDLGIRHTIGRLPLAPGYHCNNALPYTSLSFDKRKLEVLLVAQR
jgi:hypothetical protein